MSANTTTPVDPEFFGSTQEDPYPTYAALRGEAPVYHDPLSGAYIVTRYEDVAAVFRDDESKRC